MLLRDFLAFVLASGVAHPLRFFLTALGIAIGVASVVLLTAIGEGVKGYILGEFTQFGTYLVAVTPGKTSTFGISGAMFGNVRPLTLEDAAALARLPGVEAMTPSVFGNAATESQERARRTSVLGVGPQAPRVWRMEVATGRFLAGNDLDAAPAEAVLGHLLARELFPASPPLGQRIRVGGESFRVVGVMAAKGQFLGFDLDDAVYLPVARALSHFDREGVMEVDLTHWPALPSARMAETVKNALIQRHGQEDFTLVTQDQMLETIGGILSVLTLTVGGLGGISLLVGGVGIFTIMTISTSERVREVGLLLALGARAGRIQMLFLGEALLFGLAGGVGGVALGAGGAGLLALLAPRLPVRLSWEVVLLALGVSLLIGLLSGWLPARQAARADPVVSLRAE